MAKSLMKIISYLLHPVFMLLATVYIIFNINTFVNYTVSIQVKTTIYAILFVNTILLPSIIVLYLFNKKNISSIELNHREERWFPLIMTAFFYFFSYYLIRQIHLPTPVIYNVLFGAICCLVMILLLNNVLKISAHTCGAGGVVGALIAFSWMMKTNEIHLIVLFVLLAGLLGFTRLALQSHKQNEIYLGFGMGFFFELVSILYNLG